MSPDSKQGDVACFAKPPEDVKLPVNLARLVF